MANIKLRVTGMTCGHCQAKVERALKGTSGVYSAIVDLQLGEAEIDFEDDAATPGQLVAAVEKAGYGAKLAG
jgi:copper chaperone CopZ